MKLLKKHMHRTALFLVVPLAVHASARQLASPPASTRRQPRGQRGRRPRMQCGWAGKGGGGFTCRVPPRNQGRLDLPHPRRGAALRVPEAGG